MQTYAWTCTLIMIVFASSVKLRALTNDTGITEDFFLTDLPNGCTYTCESGTPRHNPDIIPYTDGCGVYEIIIPLDKCPYLNRCCYDHDLCYGTCGSTRADCDQEFYDCTTRAANPICAVQGRHMYQEVDLGGCDRFLNAQKYVCICE
jgi:secretory phospholipase A2